MKTFLVTFTTVALFAVSPLHAGANNGYTTAANVYTGSSSRSWFGGGTAWAISQWKAERQATVTAPAAEEAPAPAQQEETAAPDTVRPN